MNKTRERKNRQRRWPTTKEAKTSDRKQEGIFCLNSINPRQRGYIIQRGTKSEECNSCRPRRECVDIYCLLKNEKWRKCDGSRTRWTISALAVVVAAAFEKSDAAVGFLRMLT